MFMNINYVTIFAPPYILSISLCLLCASEGNLATEFDQYILNHWIEWRNGSSSTYNLSNYKDASITSSYSGFWKDFFYK